MSKVLWLKYASSFLVVFLRRFAVDVHYVRKGRNGARKVCHSPHAKITHHLWYWDFIHDREYIRLTGFGIHILP